MNNFWSKKNSMNFAHEQYLEWIPDFLPHGSILWFLVLTKRTIKSTNLGETFFAEPIYIEETQLPRAIFFTLLWYESNSSFLKLNFLEGPGLWTISKNPRSFFLINMNLNIIFLFLGIIISSIWILEVKTNHFLVRLIAYRFL